MALKFFRRYSRITLLVFMVVLMFVFVIGDVIGRSASSPDRFDEQLGTAFGRPVMLSSIRVTQSELALAGSLGSASLPVFAENDFDRSLGMFLMCEEAREFGLRFTDTQIREMLRARGVTDDIFERVRARAGLSQGQIYDLLGRFHAASLLLQLQVEGVFSESRPRLETAYREENQSADTLVSVINADIWLEKIDPPTDEQLQVLFEEGKDRFDEHTPEELVYGYKLDHRVQLEYITIDPTKIEENVLIRETEARRFFEQNRDLYTKKAEGPLLENTDQTVPMTYEEARERVREAVRTQRAIDEAQAAINKIAAEARRAWEQGEVGPDGRRATPAEADQVSFAQLAAKHADLPIQVETTEWVDSRGIAGLGGIARARYLDGQAYKTVGTMALDIDGVTPPDAVTAATLRVNEPAPVVNELRFVGGEQQPRQSYLFRVTGVQPAGPPASIEEVREKLTEDYVQVEAYEQARQVADQLAEAARSGGLEAAIEAASDISAIVEQADTDATTDLANPSTRFMEQYKPGSVIKVQRSPRLLSPVKGIFTPTLAQRVFGTLEDGDDGKGVLVIGVSNRQSWMVVEIVGFNPLYEGQFELAREQLQQQAVNQTYQQFVQGWCGIDNIRKRPANFIPAPERVQAAQAQ